MNNLFLRTCNSDGTSYGGFKWNLEIGGITEAPDWNPKSECGGGLHGLLNGKGDGIYLSSWSENTLWMVCEALGPIVDLHDKIKTPKAITLFVGDRRGATDLLIQFGCNPSEVVGAFITGGDGSTVIGGDCSTVTGGDCSIVTGGYRSTVTGGNHSTVTGGDCSIVTGGYRSTVTGGDYSTVTGGEYSTVTGGNYSTVTGGYRSIVTGSKFSTIAGGYGSTVKSDTGSILSLKWFDGKRTRISIAYVGEDGIKSKVAYRLDDNGKFVRA